MLFTFSFVSSTDSDTAYLRCVSTVRGSCSWYHLFKYNFNGSRYNLGTVLLNLHLMPSYFLSLQLKACLLYKELSSKETPSKSGSPDPDLRLVPTCGEVEFIRVKDKDQHLYFSLQEKVIKDVLYFTLIEFIRSLTLNLAS